MDTLSILLSMANVTAHSDVLVVDMIGGILTGAVAERMGGICYLLLRLEPSPNSLSLSLYLSIQIFSHFLPLFICFSSPSLLSVSIFSLCFFSFLS